MLNEKNGQFELSDLLNAESLKDFLDVDKAVTLGFSYNELSMIPEFRDKFGEEINEIIGKFDEYKDKLSEILDTMPEESTILDLLETGIDAYESEDDKRNVAILLGMYAEHCISTKNEE